MRVNTRTLANKPDPSRRPLRLHSSTAYTTSWSPMKTEAVTLQFSWEIWTSNHSARKMHRGVNAFSMHYTQMLARVCTQMHDHGRDMTKKACLACFDGVSLVQDHDLGCQCLQLVLQLGDKVVAGDEKLKLFAFQLAVLALQQNQVRCAVLLPGR